MLSASNPDVSPRAGPPQPPEPRQQRKPPQGDGHPLGAVGDHPNARGGLEGRAGRRLRLNAAACFGASLLAIPLTIALEGLRVPSPIVILVGRVGVVLFVFSILIALYRVVRGIVDLVHPVPERASLGTGEAIAAILGNLFLAGFGMLIAYFATVGFSRGRQLRRLGRVLLPSLRSSSAWTTCTVVLDQLEDAPRGVADQWRENGKTEHASVAAFARLTLDLMALGAPPTLIAAANQDALDEIRHTELCFSLACALDGKSVSPGPFPEAQRVATLPRSRTLALANLAVDSLVDGALHEGVSARIIARLAQRCSVPAIRAALKEIAADEGRHAAHGWAVVGWCLDEGGSSVGEALLGAIRALPKQMNSQLPKPASEGGWERWGIHGRGLEAVEYAAALAHVTQRVHAMVATLSSKVA
jgi:hypothetical protein